MEPIYKTPACSASTTSMIEYWIDWEDWDFIGKQKMLFGSLYKFVIIYKGKPISLKL